MTKRLSPEEELVKLKSENSKLKKEVSRLTKYLNRAPSHTDDFDTNLKPKAGLDCPKCKSSNIGEVKLNNRRLVVCRECAWRKML